MPLLLLTGTGGAGTTTVAVATALALAAEGRASVVIGMNGPAGALALHDVLGEVAQELPVGLAVVPSANEFGKWPSELDAEGLARGLGLGTLAPIQRGGIGLLEDLASWTTVAQWAADPEVAVVLDLGPLARALELIQLPSVLAAQLGASFDVSTRVRRALAAGAAAGGQDVVIQAVDQILTLSQSVTALITDLARTRLRMVVADSALNIRRANRAGAVLALHQVAVERYLMRADLEDGGVVEQWSKSAEPGEPPAVLSGAVRGLPWIGPEPVGKLLAEASAGWATVLLDEGHVSPEPVGVLGVAAHEQEYTLTVRLPGATKADLVASRFGDHLLLKVFGHPRLVKLPSGLQRCTVVGAHWNDPELQISFRPNPALWP